MRLVMFSGGVGSWAAAKRTIEQYGQKQTRLVFADTLMEDEDLYRFLDEAAENIGAKLVRLVEGRDPWQVFFDVRFLGNTRVDPCSRILKRELIRKWVEDNYRPDEATLVLGIDWSEIHRLGPVQRHWHPYKVEAPLTEPPYITKQDWLERLESKGIEPPRLYRMGFPHNNCGGFCVKAGHTQFLKLLRQMPARYSEHEQKEQEIREYLDADVSILRDRTGGELKPLTLREFRERIERDGCEQVDLFDWGGCGCFVDVDVTDE